MPRTVIEIDETLCNGCGNCVTGCFEGALQLIDGKARLISDQLCDGLGACIGECPVGAIRSVEREAGPYNERQVMERLMPQGLNTVLAHLRHLQSHGQKQWVEEALALLREPAAHAAGWDVQSIQDALGMGRQPAAASGCPGSRVSHWTPLADPAPALQAADSHSVPSALRQWPIQLRLVPAGAPFLQGAELLIAADCVPFTYAAFHQDFLRGKVLLIACPKLDDVSSYTEKLVQIFSQQAIRSVTVVRMEVPCCGGLTAIVKSALASSAALIPYAEAVISITGERLAQR